MMAGSKKFFYSERNTACFRVPDEYARYIKSSAKNAAEAAMTGQEKAPVLRSTEKAAGRAGVKSAPQEDFREMQNGSSRAAGKKNKKKSRFDVNFIIRIVAIVVMVFSLVIIVEKCGEYIRDIKYNNAFNDNFKLEASVNEQLSARKPPVYPVFEGSSDVDRVEYPVVYDRDGLKQLSLVYKDFRCWFYIENTTIQYPVAQAVDNDYYLNHNLDGQESLSGSLFLDFRNDINQMHGNNIIYGHNMQNGTMFGGLKKYTDREYFFSHQMIYTYTAEEVTAWKVFSAYETTTDNYYIETYFRTDEDYLKFLNKLKSDSLFDAGITLGAEDDILTLSTCHRYNTGNNGRFVIHAVKVGSSPLV